MASHILTWSNCIIYFHRLICVDSEDDVTRDMECEVIAMIESHTRLYGRKRGTYQYRCKTDEGASVLGDAQLLSNRAVVNTVGIDL